MRFASAPRPLPPLQHLPLATVRTLMRSLSRVYELVLLEQELVGEPLMTVGVLTLERLVDCNRNAHVIDTLEIEWVQSATHINRTHYQELGILAKLSLK